MYAWVVVATTISKRTNTYCIDRLLLLPMMRERGGLASWLLLLQLFILRNLYAPKRATNGQITYVVGRNYITFICQSLLTYIQGFNKVDEWVVSKAFALQSFDWSHCIEYMVFKSLLGNWLRRACVKHGLFNLFNLLKIILVIFLYSRGVSASIF